MELTIPVNVYTVIVGIALVFVFLRGVVGRSQNSRATLSEDGHTTIEDVKRLVLSSQKVSAIKLYREITNVGLKEAKDEVEKIEVEMRKQGLLR